MQYRSLVRRQPLETDSSQRAKMQSTSSLSVLLLFLQLQGLLVFTPASGFLKQNDLGEVCRYKSKSEIENVRALESDTLQSREHEEYAIDWNVNISDGRNAADEIAERHGFINKGLVDEDGMYHFVLKEDEILHMPRYESYVNKTRQLTMEESVVFAEQKTVEIVCSKSSRMGSTGREKRQSRATNLRADWQPLGRVVVRWNHPSTGPPELRYRLNHAAIVISSGTSTVTYRHVTIPRVDTSITLSGVSRNNINIFHLNAVYRSSFYSAIFLTGNATLPAPVTQIETLNSTSIRVSWQPISTGQPIRYYVVLYNGNLIQQRSAGASTSLVVDGLDHLDAFIVFVVAISGNAYGASYQIYTLEAVRLVSDGENPCEGRVEVYHNGRWGTVCDDFWDLTDANVVCSQVSCGAAVEAPCCARFGRGTGQIWLDNVQCTTQDEFLEHCRSNGWGIHNCNHGDDASVRCAAPELPTFDTSTPPTSPTALCPTLTSITNGLLLFSGFTPGSTATYTCNDGYQLQGNAIRTCQENRQWSGEDPACVACITNECPSGGTVRLISESGNRCEGRVEVYHNGQWGTVCDDLWGITDANVVCSQVSCGAAVKAPCCAQFGQGTGPIWLDNVQCTAQDEFLEQCGSNDWGVHNCGHGEDASVICGGVCSELPNPANGGVTWTGLTSGSTATYRCNSGHQLTGDQTRTCQNNGIWSGEEPTCTLVPPTNVSATQLNATSARVSWVPPLGVPPTLYNINVYYTPVEINGQMQHTSVPGTSNSLVLTQLNEGLYIIVVIVGDDTASAIIIIIIIE